MDTLLQTVLMLGSSLLSILMLTILFSYPLVTLVQCWLYKKHSKVEKIVWSAFIIVTWFLFGIGALIYGLVSYKKLFKLVPLMIVIGAILSFVLASSSFVNLSYKFTTEMVDEHVHDFARRTELLSNMKELKEPSVAGNDGHFNAFLSGYLGVLVVDGLTDEEYETWKKLYSDRGNLTDQDMDRIMRKIKRESLEDKPELKLELEDSRE